MKRNGVLLILLTVISLPLSLYQNLQADEAIYCVEQDKPKLLNPKSETCGEFVGLVEQSEIQQSNPKSETCGEQSRTIQNPKLDKKEFAQKTMKLHMPFIANDGQMDEQVKFYAKTFGGTVFVTKEGEIVYALPNNSSEFGLHGRDKEQASKIRCQGLGIGEMSYVPRLTGNGIRSNHNALDLFSISYGELLSQIRNPKHVASGVEPSETCGEQSRTIQNQKSGVALREGFVGSKIKAIQGVQPSVTKVSYFEGNDPSKWKTNISTYDTVNLGEIYDGIELKLRAYGNNVEKLFCIRPGADPEKIKIRLSGLKDCEVQNAEITHPLVPSRERISQKSESQNSKLQINKSGELVAETELGLVKFTKPVAYQEIEGKRVEVDVVYNISNPKSQIRNPRFEYGFKVASYDRTKPLIIDPLLASTFLGGSSDEYGYSITLDTNGNVYVTGWTSSTNFPTTSGSYDTSWNGGNIDVFVSKLDSGLTSLLASTYLGGSGSDVGYAIGIDTSGNVYVTGSTLSRNFPMTIGAYDTSYNVFGNVFVSKLNSGLSKLLASTFLGGSNNDYGDSLTLDTSGNVYVTGLTKSKNFPTTGEAYDTSYNGGYSDVFVSKLDGGLTSLVASTFLGGTYNDYVYAISLDTSGNVYVTGETYSTDFPTTSGAYDTSYNGFGDAFVSKLNSGLTSLLASTFLGGTHDDNGYAISLDTSGNVYVTGKKTYSTDFPTTSGAYDTSYNGFGDVFVSKLNSGLTSLLASTFLGGTYDDEGYAISLDTSGNVYVTGHTLSRNFPTTIGAYDTSFNSGYSDVFVSKLDGGLTSLLASTYLGGSYDDWSSYSLTLDTSGNVYVTGETGSTNFPTTSGAYDTSFNVYDDVFVSKLDSDLSASATCIGAIGGQVIDAITGDPIVGASVAYGVGTSRQDRTIIGRTTTNAQGAYAFQGVECGNYVVIAGANGYRRSTRTNVAQVSVEGGTREQADFELQPRRNSK